MSDFNSIHSSALPKASVEVQVSASSTPAGGQLAPQLVGDLRGTFVVRDYQRGYRWRSEDVLRLLDDLWSNGDRDYWLQPITVLPAGEDKWELVDGQQRLTTLFLLFRCMEREELQSEGPPFDLEYETRPGSRQFLDSLEPELATTNIDYHHLFVAYTTIRDWLAGHGHRRQNAANKLYGYLFDCVKVLWYRPPEGTDARRLFRNLNVGKIALTDAELLKADLLRRRPVSPGGGDRTREIVAAWDAIERDLHDERFWAFLTPEAPSLYPTRITLLLDTVAGGPLGRSRPRFHTFLTLAERINNEGPGAVWDEVVQRFGLLRGWFDDPSAYHLVGCAVSLGEPLRELVGEAVTRKRTDFFEWLTGRVRQRVNVTWRGVQELRYGKHSRPLGQLLLLANAETVRRLDDRHRRYPFEQHHTGGWSLEHIHAQRPEGFNKQHQWQSWLTHHRDALGGLAPSPRRDALAERIDGALPAIDAKTFNELAAEVVACFETQGEPLLEPHGLGNLALLQQRDNSRLSNAVFEVKRRRILEIDRRGGYLPPCTRRVFLKYYSAAEDLQLNYWSERDREAYLEALRELLQPYLRPEEDQP